MFLHLGVFSFSYAFIKALKLCTLVFLYTGKASVSVSFIKSNQYYLSFSTSSVISFQFDHLNQLVAHCMLLFCYFMGLFLIGAELTCMKGCCFLSLGGTLCEDCLLLFYSSLFYLRCPLEFSSTKVHFLNIYI